MSAPLDVWIDTDPAIGVPGADVDDGLALVQAFHSPELRVRGVSAVFGNAPLETTHPLAVELVERFGPPGLAALRGAGAAAELGRANDAIAGLALALRERPLHVLALGPVTNVAGLLRLHPELAPRIASIVTVAARRPGQRFLSAPDQPTPFPDLNFECDPEAMRVLLASRRPLVFAPWELSSHVWITAADLDALARGGPSGRYLAAQSRAWLQIWQRDLRAPGFNPFDTLAVAWLTHPHWLEHFACSVRIEDGPDDTAPADAPTRSKPHLLVEPAPPEGVPRALYCHRPHADFKALLLQRLAGGPGSRDPAQG